MSKSKSDADKQAAIARLRSVLNPGDTVYTILRHVSRSGMQREISCLAFDRNVLWDAEMSARGYTRQTRDKMVADKIAREGIMTIDYEVSRAIGARIGKHGGIVVGGTGMDMGFHLVYSLGRALWPDGTPGPHGTRNGQPDSDGGYALNHVWL